MLYINGKVVYKILECTKVRQKTPRVNSISSGGSEKLINLNLARNVIFLKKNCLNCLPHVSRGRKVTFLYRYPTSFNYLCNTRSRLV